MSHPHLARNTLFITSALVFQKILSLIYFWLISNRLSPDTIGQYVFALSFTTLFSILVDLGLAPVLTRQISRQPQETQTLLSGATALKIPLALFAISAALITITFSHSSPTIIALVAVASLIMVLDSFTMTYWVTLRAHQRLIYESIGTVCVQIIIISTGIFALTVYGSVMSLMLALLTASIAHAFFAGWQVKRQLRIGLLPRWQPAVVRQLLLLLPAFALSGVVVKIYNAADSVLLGYLSSDAAVGYFAVPAKIVYALQQIVPAALASALFPVFSHYYQTQREKLGGVFTQACTYLLIISIPAAAGIIVLAKPLIAGLWPTYLVAIPTLMVMAAALPWIFLTFPTGYLLNACDQQRRNTIHRCIITAVAIILNIILIPKFSFLGAGITFLITNILLFILDILRCHSIVHVHWLTVTQTIVKVLVATGAMIIVLYAGMTYLPLLALIAFAGITYFVTLFLVRGINRTMITAIFAKRYD